RGPDGAIWFTDQGTTKAIGQITLTDAGWTTTNHDLASTSLPGGIRTGPRRQPVVHGQRRAAGDRAVRRGRTGAVDSGAAGRGSGKEGDALHCNKGKWSRWAGDKPSRTRFGFDG